MSIKLKHSGGNSVSLNPPTSAPTSSDVAFKLPNADGSANQLLKTDGSGNLAFVSVAGGLFSSYAIIADRKSRGTDGGAVPSGTNVWFTRTLNTEIADPDGIVSISSNQFTLAAGTYLIKWRVPASRIKTFMTALYNVTDSSYTEYGQTSYSDFSDGSNDYGNGLARVVISGSKAFEIRMITESTDGNAQHGLGRTVLSSLTNFTGNETYTVVEIYKES